MSLKLTNTLTRRIEQFVPLESNKVRIYCCGVTVYDFCHLGHARSYINWDVLRRYLIWQGYQVKFVQNFTDIDDKILNRAAEEGCTMEEVSERNIKAFHEDMDALGILRPDSMPRATKCLDGIQNLVKELVVNGFAYSVDGDVYFSVMKCRDYGKLSSRDLEEQQNNADGRVGDQEHIRKNHPFDFALWKGAKNFEPGFDSPWGKGRPGWHIECSAMVREELGDTIDIHLGGADLIFPHHENEIAQSEMATGKTLSRYWLHNGMVNVGGQKMSKSLGNFTTIRDLLLSGISPMTLRLFVMQAHYRKPIDFSDKALKAASSGWNGLNRALQLGLIFPSQLGWSESYVDYSVVIKSIEDSVTEKTKDQYQRFVVAMDDDLNTSAALAVLFELARPLRSLRNKIERGDRTFGKEIDLDALYLRWKLLVQLAGVLGIKHESLADNSLQDQKLVDNEFINEAIASRREAKLRKDFVKADQIREDLKAAGIELIDKPDGITEWIFLNS